MILQLVDALDPPIGEVALLDAVELGPLASFELVVEVEYEVGVEEVYESVAHVGLVFEVDGQVEKVVPVVVPSLDLAEQRALLVLVGDVLDHQAGALVLSGFHFLEVDIVFLGEQGAVCRHGVVNG